MRILKPSAYVPTARALWRNARARDAVFPFYASLKVTSRCHFGCPFCNVKKDPVPDLGTERIKSILDNLSRSSVLMTSFEGGEPLLRDDIGELLRYARSCNFYLLFTTSARSLLGYPLTEYARYIDFLHVSIDEGHGNLDMFGLLPELTKLPTQVSVQVVVTRDSVSVLEDKIRRCRSAGANVVVIPAAAMENAKDCFPDMNALEKTLMALRRKYPNTMHTPREFFKAYRSGKCSSASVIISPDGKLFYPCNIKGHKGPDLAETDLTEWLQSKEAAAMRQSMKECTRNCGWYQYYAINSYVSPRSAWEALRPMLLQGK